MRIASQAKVYQSRRMRWRSQLASESPVPERGSEAVIVDIVLLSGLRTGRQAR
jgi:hypothetical protein